jgi:WD40 repeat protein
MMLPTGRADSPAPPPAPPAKESAAKSGPKLDAFGDPLPDGAIARLGTVRFNHGDGMRSLLYSPDGKTIVSVGNGRARVWDADTGAELRQFSTGTADWNEEAVLTPDGKNLVLLIQSFQNDPLRVFDVETGKSLRDTKLQVRRNEMSIERKNTLSPDGKLAALFGPDRIQVHDVETTKQLYALPKKGREVKSISFAGPDLLVTADQAKKIEVWEARTGKLVHSFDHGGPVGPVGPVGTIAASADGKLLATVEHTTMHVEKFLEKDVVRIWDLAAGKQKHELASRRDRWFMRIGFSPDGKFVHAYSLGRNAYEVHVWNVETGKQVGETHDAVGQVMAMSPDSKRVVAGSEHGGKFDAWDAVSGKLVVTAEAPGPWAGTVHLSPTGDRVLTLTANALVQWDGTTGRPIKTTPLDPHLAERPWCQFSSNGRYAVLVQANEKDGKVVIWDLTAGRATLTIPVAEPPHGIAAAFSQDSSRVAIRLLGKDPKVTIRDLKTGKESAAIRVRSDDWPDQMFFGPDGQTLVVSGKRTVGYNLPSGKEEFAWVMAPEPIKGNAQIGIAGGAMMSESDRRAWRSLVISPDGTLAACVLDAGWSPKATIRDRIALCDARTGKVIRRWADSGKQSRGYEVTAFSPDGRLLATSEGNDIHLWEVATGKEVRAYRGHRNEVHAMAFSANGRRLASSGSDATTVIWDLSAPNEGSADAAARWTELLNEDAAKAYPAVWRLADAADDVVIPYLKKQIQPVTEEDMAKIRRAIRDLDSDEFRIRDRAFKDLADLGYAAQAPLRAVLDKQPSAESRNRVEQLLAKVTGPPAAGESLRTARALSVLESKRSAAANELLRELANGAPDAWLTQEAKSALARSSK